MKSIPSQLKIEPLSPANWNAFEKLFGLRGACASCWCMHYRLPNQDFVAVILEAYPVIPTTGKLPDSFAWTGLFTAFERAGFRIVDRKSKNRPMVRWYRGPGQ